jgi:hypothetical protein
MKARWICVAALALAGCASTRSATRDASPATTSQAARRCAARAILLAGAAHHPSHPIAVGDDHGLVIVWAEQARRATLRFLATDRRGKPLGPDTELVDRDHAMEPSSFFREPDGWVITWLEGDALFARRVDARGRPRSDVGPGQGGLGLAGHSRCANDGRGVRCTTSHGDTLELPASAHLEQELLDEDALIASDAEGLKLYVQACE